MARTGRPVAEVVLSDDERRDVAALVAASEVVAGPGFAQSDRARLFRGEGEQAGRRRVGACAADGRDMATSVRRVPLGRVGSTSPGPGAPRKITDEQIEALVVATLERAPADATHWSRASMAAESGLSRSTVGRIWKAFGLKPHQVETFKLSTDPQFVDKVRDVVGLYLDPPEQGAAGRALVLVADRPSSSLRRGVHKNLQALERDIRAWIAQWNDNPQPFIWTKTADEIL